MSKFPFKPNPPYIPDPYVIPQQKEKVDEMKTPEEMAEEYLDQDKVVCAAINRDAEDLVKDASLAGYQAAKDETNLPTSAKWISVKDRLPEPLESVLIIYAPTNAAKNDCRMECWNWPETDVYETKFITHWMPLPEPPKEEK